MALRALLQFIITIAVIIKFSPSDLGAYATREIMVCLGFVFAKEMLLIQLAHVSDTDYYPLYILNGIIINALLANTLLHAVGVGIVGEYQALIGLTVTAAVSYAHAAYTSAQEISNTLGIFIFKVNKGKNT